MSYVETFDDGPGGWYGWISNAAGPKPLEIRDSCAVSRSPWWIDYDHAPPARLPCIFCTCSTPPASPASITARWPAPTASSTWLSHRFHRRKRMTVRLKGELEARGADLVLLCQSVRDGICSGWMLTGQPLRVTADWSEQTITAVPDAAQWECLGSRHDRTDFYGRIPRRPCSAT